MSEEMIDEGVTYITLEGGEFTIESLEKAKAIEQAKVDKAEILKKMVEDGSFYKLFSIESRREEIMLLVSHLNNPLHKNKIQDELAMHSGMDNYFRQLIFIGNHAKQAIDELDREIERLMNEG